MDSRREQRGIISEALHHLAVSVESHHKSFVEIRADRVLQKTNGRILFEIEPSTHRSASIDQKPKLDGKVGLAAKIYNRLRRQMIVEDCKVFLVKVAHKLAMLVGGNKKHVDFV